MKLVFDARELLMVNQEGNDSSNRISRDLKLGLLLAQAETIIFFFQKL